DGGLGRSTFASWALSRLRGTVVVVEGAFLAELSFLIHNGVFLIHNGVAIPRGVSCRLCADHAESGSYSPLYGSRYTVTRLLSCPSAARYSSAGPAFTKVGSCSSIK